MEVPDGRIEFKHVDFAYYKDSETEPVLTDINLSIQSGETIGIHGRNRKCQDQSGQSDQPSLRCDERRIARRRSQT